MASPRSVDRAPTAPTFAVPCKICCADAHVFDTVDAAKNCCEPMGLYLPPTGTAVTYHRCVACGFVFTAWCDAFTDEDFRREIYNDGYAQVDPLYREIRPRGSARLLREVFADACRFEAPPRLLDYGAGSGTLAALLGDRARTESFDPFSATPDHATRPTERFDVVFASEVIEHVTRPIETIAAMRDLLRPGGFMLFSTMVTPPDIDTVRASWWYISPRNGHVSIFTPAALAAACAQTGLHYTALSDEWHLAEHRDAPCERLDRDALLAIVARLPTGFVTV